MFDQGKRSALVLFAGQLVGHVQVGRILGGSGQLQFYGGHFTCCGRLCVITHKRLLSLRLRSAHPDYTGLCRVCQAKQAARNRGGGLSLPWPEADGPVLPEPEPRSLVVPSPTRAERIAALRAENARRVAQAHQWAMGAR